MLKRIVYTGESGNGRSTRLECVADVLQADLESTDPELIVSFHPLAGTARLRRNQIVSVEEPPKGVRKVQLPQRLREPKPPRDPKLRGRSIDFMVVDDVAEPSRPVRAPAALGAPYGNSNEGGGMSETGSYGGLVGHSPPQLPDEVKTAELIDGYKKPWEGKAEKAPDENCVTLPDGSCEGEGCMHDTPPEDDRATAIETFQLKQGEWRMAFRGQLHPASWNSKGAAVAHGERCWRAGKLLA